MRTLTQPPETVPPELIAARFQALSDPTRIRILAFLRDGEHCVCDLQAALAIAQPLLSFHLKALRDAAFVTWRKQGRWAYYALHPDTLRAAHDDVARLRAPAGRKLPVKCCG
jgi:ArsR family transcriptional regulator